MMGTGRLGDRGDWVTERRGEGEMSGEK